MIKTYTSGALVKLIRSYADGRTDDEAFHDALGVDTAGFTTAWFASVNAMPHPKYGPQPAAAGPVPSVWTAGAPAGAIGSSGPAPTNGAVGSGGLPAGTAVPAAQAPASQSSDLGWLALAALIVGVVIVVAVLVARRRRTTGESW